MSKKAKSPSQDSAENAAQAAPETAMATGLPLFYKQPRPLIAENDAALGLVATTDYGFARNANSIPLVATELAMACKHFPILFTDGDMPRMIALTGLTSGENLFVGEDGGWKTGTYVPAYVRRYPFIFLESDDHSQYTLCVDEAADVIVRDGEGAPLFENGEPAEITKSALDFCRDYQAHYAATEEFLKALQAADLLVDNRADITLVGNRRLSLAGFKVIDEDRFNAMGKDEFLRWRERGWLHLVYCHFISSGNWSTLIDMAAAKPVDK